MSMLKLCLASAAQQFIANCDRAFLGRQSKLLMAAVAMTVAATATLAPAPAQAQTWAGQASAQSGGSVLPQGSAGRWGDVLGGTLGRVVSAGVVGNPNSEMGRRLQDVVSGVSEEVGRNVGRRAAEMPYSNSPNSPNTAKPNESGFQGTGQSQGVPQNQGAYSGMGNSQNAAPYGGLEASQNGYKSANRNTGYSSPSPSYIRPLPGVLPVVQMHQDNLDALAVKALVAYDDYASAIQAGNGNMNTLGVAYNRSVMALEVGLGSAVAQGVNVQPWVSARSALQQPLGGVTQAHLANLGQPMIERLNRQGGPGMAALDLSQNRQVLEMRVAQQQRQQGQTRSMPIENFGR